MIATWEQTYLKATAFLLLFGVFLMELQLPLVFGLGATLFGFLIFALTRQQVELAAYLVLLNYLYWLGSGFATGALAVPDLLSVDFLNGDGRIFISYAPLLLFGAIKSDSITSAIVRMLILLGVLTCILLVVFLLTNTPLLSQGRTNNFVGFMTSHTGSGTFFGFLAVFLFILGRESKSMLYYLIAAGCCVAILAAASRTSLFALVPAIGWYMLVKKEIRLIAGGLVSAVLIVVIMAVLYPHMWNRTTAIFSPDLVAAVSRTIENPKWVPGDRDVDLQGRHSNILERVEFWSYSAHRFIESPIVGIGYGRYNDVSPEFAGIKGVVYPVVQAEKVFSAGNAHNSYLHFLCESGLVGIFLIGILWFYLLFKLNAAAKTFRALKNLSGYLLACQSVMIFTAVSALMGHAMAAPSLMLPVSLVVGAGLSHVREISERARLARPVAQASFAY